jgi:sugar phosphate isomerase/epimerase
MKTKKTHRKFMNISNSPISYVGEDAKAGTKDVTFRVKSPFRISVINDEVSQNFERSCGIISNEFGMEFIELRGMWNKSILTLDANEIYEATRILRRYDLRVTDICSPLFKVDWPGAPRSRYVSRQDKLTTGYTYEQQDEVLERSIEVAKIFGTDRVRFFDFWRIDDQTPYRAAINQKLLETAEKAGKNGITLMLENEFACNTATGVEAARVMNAVQSPHLMLLWDPANAAMHGEKAFPEGYELLPKNRIAHCHCKDVMKSMRNGEADWTAVGNGRVDWIGQFRALKRDGYRQATSLETRWRGAGTAEMSTRQSWRGMQASLQEAGALTYGVSKMIWD